MFATQSRRAGRTELRTIECGSPDHRRFTDIAADAYPVTGLRTAALRNEAFARDREVLAGRPEHRLVGAYRDGVLVGGMRLYDFTMCVRDRQVFAGGVGSVAVGLESKRRGIARDLMAGFLTEYRERGAALATLYPFRPDFYEALGFGLGTKMNQYRIALATLPADGPRDTVRAIGPNDEHAFCAAYERAQARTNGLIRRESWRAKAQLTNEAFRTFGYADGERLGGYLTVEMRLGKAGTTNRNELFVHEFIYESPAALRGLLAFLRSQSDQFATLVLNTQDPEFHFAVPDARNGSDRNVYPPVYHETNAQALGIMYRVVDVAALVNALRDCRFGELDAVIRVDLTDPFMESNTGAHSIRFTRGRPEMIAQPALADVDLAIGVADFSSLVMGSARLRSLVAYGRAVLSHPEWLHRIDAAFETQPPQCLTRF